MKVLLAMVLSVSFFAAPAKADAQSTYASEEEFFASQPYFAFVLLNEGIACLRDNGLYELALQSAKDQYLSMRCVGEVGMLVPYLDDLFPTMPLLDIKVGALTSNAENFLLCAGGDEYTCEHARTTHYEPRPGQPPIELMDFSVWAKTTSVIIIAELYRWYYDTWCPIPDRIETSAFCTEIVGHE